MKRTMTSLGLAILLTACTQNDGRDPLTAASVASARPVLLGPVVPGEFIMDRATYHRVQALNPALTLEVLRDGTLPEPPPEVRASLPGGKPYNVPRQHLLLVRITGIEEVTESERQAYERREWGALAEYPGTSRVDPENQGQGAAL